MIGSTMRWTMPAAMALIERLEGAQVATRNRLKRRGSKSSRTG